MAPKKLLLAALGLLAVITFLYWVLFVYSSQGGVCLQVTQEAQNPITGETRTFKTPCEVPFGWRKLRSSFF